MHVIPVLCCLYCVECAAQWVLVRVCGLSPWHNCALYNFLSKRNLIYGNPVRILHFPISPLPLDMDYMMLMPERFIEMISL
jgi:hypothetical protein